MYAIICSHGFDKTQQLLGKRSEHRIETGIGQARGTLWECEIVERDGRDGGCEL